MEVHPINVLIVDDNDTVLNALEFNLKESGFRVRKAADGKEALGIVAKEPIDIIISDVAMPEMDGIEFCENVRRIPEYHDVPFIFLTAHGREDEKIKGWMSGADEYIVKPFKMSEVIARARTLHERIRQKRAFTKFAGNIRDIPVIEVLQFFEISRKKGVLHLASPEGKGAIVFREGTIVDAAWNALRGTDAILEILSVREGMFDFEPGEAPPGPMTEPLNGTLIDIVQLMDELPVYESYIPGDDAPLVLADPGASPEDPVCGLVAASLADGIRTLADLKGCLGVAGARLKIAVAKLVKEGIVRAAGEPAPARRKGGPPAPVVSVQAAAHPAAKPRNLIVAFTCEEAAARCLGILGEAGTPAVRSLGFSDYRRVVFAPDVYNVFLLRGEKRFRFLWEPVLKSSAGGIFIVSASGDVEHAEAFRASSAAHRRPAATVCFDRSLEKLGAVPIATRDDLAAVVAKLASEPDGTESVETI